MISGSGIPLLDDRSTPHEQDGVTFLASNARSQSRGAAEQGDEADEAFGGTRAR
jgi:hypothetical protein